MLKPFNFLARYGLGLLFTWSGMVKLLDIPGFQKILARYAFMPGSLVEITALALPTLELILGLMLLSGLLIHIATIGISILLIVFIPATLVNLILGIDTSCGCFSTSTQPTNSVNGILTLTRNVVLLALSIYIFRQSKKFERQKTNT